jgi:hypothetical protein
MIVICVDPGQNGGIAWLDEQGRVVADTMPESMTEIHSYFENFSFYSTDHKDCMAFIEKTGGYVPGNSGPGAVKYAKHIGHIEMALYAAGIPCEQIAPAVWMRALGVPPKLGKTERKNWIKDYVQRHFPSLKVTLKTSDALGMLLYVTRRK